MASLDQFLAALFSSLGPTGSLMALLVIFAVDAAVFPALPELWIVVTYTYRPDVMDPTVWAVLLLAVAIAGDVLGTSALYGAVRRWVVHRRRMPRWLERAMQRWTSFLIVLDENGSLTSSPRRRGTENVRRGPSRGVVQDGRRDVLL